MKREVKKINREVEIKMEETANAEVTMSSQEDTLEKLAEEYYMCNSKIKDFKAIQDGVKKTVKELLGDEPIKIVGEYKISNSVSNTPVPNMDKLLAKMQKLATDTDNHDLRASILDCIELVPTINEEKLETLLYKEILPEGFGSDCVDTKTSTRFTITKIKPKKK